MRRRRTPFNPDGTFWQVERERHGIESATPPPDGDFTPLDKVLDEVVSTMGLAQAIWLKTLNEDWSELAGPALGARSRPGPFEHGTLVVYVANSAWLSELARYGKRELTQRLQDRFGRDRVRRIRFQLDPEPPQS